MRWAGTQRNYGSKAISGKGARAAVTMLLWQCRPEMLGTFTAESLAKSYRVDAAWAARELEAAKRGRG